MTFDKEEHRVLVLEMLDRAQFIGAARDLVYELGKAVESAKVDPSANPSTQA